jgi:hypothetical protein
MLRKITRVLAGACAVFSLTSTSATEPPGTITQDFSTNPLATGWEFHGDTNLFVWDAVNENLRVTWDSSKSNSYLRVPLPRTVTSEEDFAFSAELLLRDINIGVRPGYPGTFQIAFGLQHRTDADKTTFIRGTGADSPNLVEFNYMPDSGFGATVWPAMFPTNGAMNYSGAGDFSVFELPVGVKMEIALAYTASNHTATLTITTNGMLVGKVTDAPLVEVEKGFVLDAFAIASYSDAGQDPSYPGSILAHGVVDNIRIIPPPSPVRAARGTIVSGQWEHQVLTRKGWHYVLERTTGLAAWSDASTEAEGTGDWIKLSAPLSGGHQFFRVKAIR